jgi:F0F1-type ATP synthase epsilon subunit
VRIHGVHGDGPVAGAVASSDAGTRTGGTAEATESGSTRDVIAAVHGGFVKVADNKVTVVAPVAELAGEIDVDRATRALEAAEAQSTAAAEPDRDAGEHPSGDMTEAEAAAARARVRLEAANAISAGPSMT